MYIYNIFCQYWRKRLSKMW